MSIIFLPFRERQRQTEEKVGDGSERHYVGGEVERTISSV
jgi:hypothetical protein